MACPLCNGTYTGRHLCPCGSLMEDAGPVSDYYGPYSPYFNLAFEATVCMHLFICPACGREQRVAVHTTGEPRKCRANNYMEDDN
ncbi:hypothetical protein SAMN02745218_02848 [Desulfofundulus australicus DSM 11792]|uniref:Uncharacterized protein n=1 Tax=Desulfofundulus australicus DSM 11792 TaxID=1121425 RepID=A0A1M5DKC5_9FIRM|nr:hypothetical protein [Desulfofundulus australicus]SHF67400.1 hypothetical protein SAMN02745218_02848 [Desulfofundulus australicus DSM 11792]